MVNRTLINKSAYWLTPVNRCMGMTARKFASFDEMRDEEYRYWQSFSPAERVAVEHQLSAEGYRAYGSTADGRESKTVARRIERESR